MRHFSIFHKILLFNILIIISTFFVRAQNASTQGTDFWFAFMTNYVHNPPTQTCLILSAERACSATVSNPNTGWSTTVSIPAGGRVDVDIPGAQAYYNVNSTEGVAYNYGCHLVSTDTISAYSMNYQDASFDGGHLLPTSTLADEYIIETIPPGIYGSSVLIVGTENGTVIDITPSATTNTGWSANVMQTITLNAGQAFQFTTSSETASFSGTKIQTHDCKKIAVFAGNKCAQAPAGCTYCDHVYDPMIPVIYWGNHFAVTNSLTRSKDVVRVTAQNAGTTVRKNGTLVATLNAGGTYNFELTSSEAACYIETSGPAVCYLYVTGQSCGGGTGDPAMIYIAPIEQNIKKITFGTYEYGGNTTNHYVNIVTATNNVSSVRLDGANISGQFTPLTGNNAYSYARVSISHATHSLQCDSGLVAHVYGLYNVTSYGYSVGSSAVNLTNSMFVNDVSTAEIPENQLYCPFLPIDFRVDLNYNYNSITWDFGDGVGTGNTNPCPYAYDSSGVYVVTAIIERTTINNCFGTNFDTLRTTITVPPLEPIPIYRTICGGASYDFYGRILTEPGIYLDTIVTGSECDSIIELHLSLVPADPIPVFRTICPGETLDFNGIIYTDEGIYLDTIRTAAGCDSIIELHIIIANVPSVNLGNDRVVCGTEELPVLLSPNLGDGMTYQWSTSATTAALSANAEGNYSVTVTNENGCTGTDDINVRVQEGITVSVEATSDFCETGTTTLIATTNAPNLYWSTGETTPEIEANHSGAYSVRAFDGPCQETASIDLPQCPFNLYFPNCITPSFEDGNNDFFHLSNPDIVGEFEIYIYDRWGYLVFHSTDPHFQWNGNVNGKIASNNVFTWYVFASPKTDKKRQNFTGIILVL